jgi:cytochrome oxidase Cu insertion factor (SCO1/SenC/PrrC family)
MNHILVTLIVLVSFAVAAFAAGISVPCVASPTSPPKDSFYDFNMTDLSGTTRNFTDFKGKVVLVLNTASF